MFTRRTSVVAAAWIVASLSAAGVASAQAAAEPAEIRRPFRGLFGVPAGSFAKKSLDVTGSVYGAYDDNVYADQGGGIPLSSDVLTSGYYGGVQGGLAFAARGRRLGFGADLGLGAAWYPDQPVSPTYSAALTLSAELRRNLSLSLAETLIYAPEYRLGLFVSPTVPGSFTDPFAVPQNVGILHESSYRTTTNVGLSQTFHDHSTVNGYYALTSAYYPDSNLDYMSQGVGVRYSRQVTRNAGFHVGYSYGVGEYPNTVDFGQKGVHNIDTGLDYGRALSISRRTQFSFSTGSALFYANQGVLSGEDRRLDFALLGNANLTHEMGRTWTASIAYLRSVNFHEGFADPVLANSVTADVHGLISRRLQFSSSASYSAGVIGSGTSNNFDTISANTGLQYALSRALAAYANYSFYSYLLPSGVAIDPRLPLSLHRNGVRVGLQTSIPLIRAR